MSSSVTVCDVKLQLFTILTAPVHQLLLVIM